MFFDLFTVLEVGFKNHSETIQIKPLTQKPLKKPLKNHSNLHNVPYLFQHFVEITRVATAQVTRIALVFH